MRPINTKIRWIAAASCLLAISSVANAEEGVVRITDSNSSQGIATINGDSGLSAEQQEQRAAYNRIRAQLAQQNAGGSFQQVGYQMAPAGGQYYQPQMLNQAGPIQQTNCTAMGCTSGGCTSGACGGYTGYTPACGGCDPCNAGQMNWGGSCSSGNCDCNQCRSGKGRRGRKNDCDSCYADGYNERMCTLFAKATPDDGCTRWPKRWWRGQTLNYQARNQKLANCLFGWMVPSGCCGQGCPPFGKYHVTYANDPNYADSRDGMVYGAHGYGTHLSVPLAPNVRHSYNYSWGTPASRITPMGHYAGPGAAGPNMHQSW